MLKRSINLHLIFLGEVPFTLGLISRGLCKSLLGRRIGGTVTSVHNKIESTNVVGLITSQKQSCFGHILCFQNHSLQVRGLCIHFLCSLLLHPHCTGQQRSRHRIRRNAINSDSMLPQFHAQVLHQTHHRVLRRCVWVSRTRLNHRSNARSEHNAPSFSRNHYLSSVFGGVESTEHVHLENPLQVTTIKGHDRRLQTAFDASVTEQDVQLAVPRDGTVDGAFNVVVVGDVAVNIGNVIGVEVLAKGVSEVVLDVGDHHLGTVANEKPGGGFPDATGSACY
ncbi:hypothetical protein CR513_38765, partial [Mucuna pruriens]